MPEFDQLAALGGPKAVSRDPDDMFTWPIITSEDEAAVLDVLRTGRMSDTDVTEEFESEFAAWTGSRYALGFNNGTSALHGAMFALGVGAGDEIICPSVTFWASGLPALSLGATIVFADIDPTTLCIDPGDIEHRISDRTKAIIVVHYYGQPADMAPILEIAERHQIKVLEDVSHAQGGFYHGSRLGTIGTVGAMSLMSGKSLVAGEGGMLITDDRAVYERALAFGHYERYDNRIGDESLQSFKGLPLGGYKYRMHQLSSAVGRVQLRHYEDRIREIDRAMSYFWDCLEGVSGIRPRRPDRSVGDSYGGWYSPHGLYVPDELDGLSVTRFCAALRAEGVSTVPGCNIPLHLHPLLNTADVYSEGRPTRIARATSDVRQARGSLPVAESIDAHTYRVPWFKHDRRAVIDEYVRAFMKVSARHKELLEGEESSPSGP